jgi:hypothetical protein
MPRCSAIGYTTRWGDMKASIECCGTTAKETTLRGRFFSVFLACP